MTSLLEIYGKTNRLRDRDKANTQLELFSKDFDQFLVGESKKNENIGILKYVIFFKISYFCGVLACLES